MKLTPYPAYKDSGLPWLGRIPAHWEVQRNGRLFAQRIETGFPDLPILEVSLRTGVHVRDLDNTNRKQVMSNREQYKRAARGDIAYNMMRMWQGAVGVVPTDGLVSPAYVVARPFPVTDSRYYSYLFRIAAYMNEVNKYSRGIVTDRNRLYWDEFKQMPSIFPPTSEQRNIADVLDSHDRAVRRFIRSKRRLIELLNEEKQAIIHWAVTRGIDPNVRVKPSGIDWLGSVPEHWEVVRLRQVSRCLDGQRVPLNAVERESMQGPYPYWGANRVIDHLDRWLFDEDLVLLGEDGAPFFERGREVSFFVTGKVWVNNHTHVLRARGPVISRFLVHVLNSVNYASYVGGATRDKLTQQAMKVIPVQLPPVDEQYKILDWIEVHLQPLRSSIARTRRGIDLIREYRTRLISDVITGKLDVRDVEMPTLDAFDISDDVISDDVAELAEKLGEIEVTDEDDAD